MRQPVPKPPTAPASPSQAPEPTEPLALRMWARVEIAREVAGVFRSRPFAAVLVALIGALAGC